MHDPEIKNLNIVFLGDFNPKIFQPAWFAAENLIRKHESEDAKIEIIHPEIVIITFDWGRLEVTRERFVLSTKQDPYYEVLRDLVIGTFKLLRHTPIKMVGINAEMHFRMRSTEEWHGFGDLLAPKLIWNEILDKPGMRSLVMEESVRQDGLKGYVRVMIEPSNKVQPGVCFKINDHYEVKDIKTAMGSDEIIEIFEQSWDKSLKRATNIIDFLLEKR
ncbi:MAG: hypothetical protein ACMUIP_17325 [bacterium]